MPPYQYIQRALHSACIDNFARGVTFINQYTANSRSAPCVAVTGSRGAIIATIASAVGLLVADLLMPSVNTRPTLTTTEDVVTAMWVLLHFEEVTVNQFVIMYWQPLNPLTLDV